MSTCPVCGRPCDASPSEPDQFGYACARCGRYNITGTALAILQAINVQDRRRLGLTIYLRNANRAGEIPLLTSSTWETAADVYQHTSVSAKLHMVLTYVREKTVTAGSGVEIYQALDHPLFHADESEVGFLIQILVERELLGRKPNGELYLTADGWELLEPVGGGGVPGACFVAMSFKPEMNRAYDVGIHPALSDDCGFDDVRIDRTEHVENINDKIIVDIRRAQFVVADFTFHAKGVYFEAGYALGMAKTVIWTCNVTDFTLDKVHFDVRPYNHIVWKTEEELRERLRNRVRALVPNAKLA